MQTERSLPTVMVLELHRLKSIHFGGSLLDDLALLAHAEALELFEAHAHERIKVTRMPARSLHVNAARLIVPELLVVLLFDRERANPLQIRALLEIWLVGAPAWQQMRRLRHAIRLEVNRLRQVPAVANVTVHRDVVLARDAGQVFLVRQRLERRYTRAI